MYWSSRDLAQLIAKIKAQNVFALFGSGGGGGEPVITPGTSAQYWRGDKTWQTLNKTAVGLSNADNTADADKPVSIATTGALAGKQAVSTKLSALDALTWASNKIVRLTAAATADLLDFSTDGTLAANSDTVIASQKAIKTYVDQIIAAQDAMVFKGLVDCSANPNYPAADRGHTYRVSVAGKIGGASGPNVEAGDILMCLTDGTAAGTHAAVGASWGIIQTNIDGALVSGGALGTPSSGTLTNCSGLPIASGVSGLAANVAAFLASPTSANMAAMLTDETGSGSNVFGTAPDLTNVKLLGTAYLQQGAQTSLNAAATLTIAQLLTGIIQYTGSAANLTLPTGTSIEGGVLAGLAVDRAFEFAIINTGSGAATVVTNTGLTTVGSLTVTNGTSAKFRVRKTATNTYTVYRVG